MENRTASILVVDDESEMREMIADYLSDMEGYAVVSARDGPGALALLGSGTQADLVLSDINMPGMRGFELLSRVREQYPHVKRMLITAYNVEDYFELALKYDVGNIFVKTTPFNFPELSMGIENLLTNNIFGPERYFENGQVCGGFAVRRSEEIPVVAREIVQILPESVRQSKVELVIVELLTNAVFYGARQESPENKASWNHEFELSEMQAITITVIRDNEKYGVSVTDNGGRVSKNDVLHWLNRQSTRDDSGLPLGVLDTHGRGLFIARKYIDRLVINIDKDKKTEVIIINYLSDIYKGYKPLYINEL